MGLSSLINEGPTSRQSGICKTCQWLRGLDPDTRSTAETLIAAATDAGDWLYSHKQLARDLEDAGLRASDSAVANHRVAHVAR